MQVQEHFLLWHMEISYSPPLTMYSLNFPKVQLVFILVQGGPSKCFASKANMLLPPEHIPDYSLLHSSHLSSCKEISLRI